MVSEEYLAGFIDGEGSLSLARIPRPKASHEYCLRVSIANTDRRILEELQKNFGGTLACSRFGKRGWKPGYALIWTNAAARRLLRKIAPYLRVKSEQVKALLDFSDHVKRYRRTRDQQGRLLPLASGERAVREAFYEHVQKLNERGISGEVLQRARLEDEGNRESEGRLLTLRYLGGFIDGEGAVMIARSHGQAPGTIYYRARLELTNTHRGILQEIGRQYGGILVKYKRRNPRWKRCCKLVWTNGMCESLLSAVLSHLRVKREQAVLLLRFVEHVQSTPRPRTSNGRYFAPLPEEVNALREAMYWQMRRLNAKGMPRGPDGRKPKGLARR